ncbi:MAG: hypothetical protein AB4050_10060 [Synechococcus sp.]
MIPKNFNPSALVRSTAADAPPSDAVPPEGSQPTDNPSSQSLPPTNSTYSRYHCTQTNPLICTLARAGSATSDRLCTTCQFPAPLANEAELLGRKGRYRIERLAGFRGDGRLYAATEMTSGDAVAIKEYVLPGLYFDEAQARLRMDSFLEVAGVHLADGRAPDMRVLVPQDAIADRRQQRCYAIFDAAALSPSLSDRMGQSIPVSFEQVRRMLQQVLQSLEYLHEQKFRLAGGQVVDGIAVGNLSPETLLWVERDRQPFVYASDLTLWENLFDPQANTAAPVSPDADLQALGQVAYSLLSGTTSVTVDDNPLSEDSFQEASGWTTAPTPLQHFIERLLGTGVPFESAAEAREHLPQGAMPESDDLPEVQEVPEEREQSDWRSAKWPIWLGAIAAAILAGAFVGWLAMWLLGRGRARQQTEVTAPIANEWSDVDSIPVGRFYYSSITRGVWDWVRLEAQQNNDPLEAQLGQVQPELALQHIPSETWQEAIDAVNRGDIDFAVLPLVGELPLTLTAEPIAYDGLAVLVAFSTSLRDNSLPTHLRGRLSLEQLRQLYGGRVSGWEEVGGPDLPVQLYRSESEETSYLFEQLALDGDALSTGLIPDLPPFELMRAILQDFEAGRGNQRGGLGFLPYSLAFNQCSVYPLAIGDSSRSAIQPLTLANGRAIQPSTDLCGLKGNYSLPVERFRSDHPDRYPLSYPIGVVYPLDNSLPPIGEKIAELMTTREGQLLLQRSGLIPIHADELEN